ncbi:MAG: Ferric enterobactin receptor precursor [Mucilaginibacter sp.]|uniref:outer membrane beta-barrel family protein n=1 Tax=Mucilaginibacter sp. TaxID=1882438 RepID=UPI00262CC4AC|nr:outer membrane beta-barrel family protein [Mucilaginibacter sp.]MDB5003107.1 Ferric enterobactin receptor precursor [Mucilaginibacter sp.]
MKYIYTILFLLISFTAIRAQNNKGNGKITGKVIDSVTKQPVDYATISLFKKGAASPFNGSVTDAKGNFTIDNIAAGEYSIRIDFIGYKVHNTPSIIISNTASSISLGTILLPSSQTQLQAVNVVGKAPIVENKIDKLVYNAANDLTSQGGVALDVLKKVPMVTVDIDGNVELQGSPSIRFLINGKPSSIFGASLADALQSIPASQIKNIEVITIPGAKYDAAGTGGIINIVLKDNKVQGFNGSVNASVGTRLDNASLNLNARSGNVGVNAFFSGNQQLNTLGKSSSQRTAYNNTRDTLTQLLQDGSTAFKRSGYQTGINFNWAITKHDEVTAAISYDQSNNLNNGLTNQNQGTYVANNLVSQLLSLRNSTSNSHNHAVDMSLEYKKTFKKEGQELSIQYNSSLGHNSGEALQRQDYLTGGNFATGIRSSNPGKEGEINISADYTHPVTEDFTLEGGAKTVIETINSNTFTDTLLHNGNYVVNPNQTYGFNYHRNIYAGYMSVSAELFSHFLQIKTGLRYERTITTVDFPGTNIPGYNIFAPSLVFLHTISKGQSIKLSYSYRIERPDYGDLNPFYNISDPHNISTGNPNLKPEIGHNYELGYSKNFESGGNIYAAAVYRHNTDDAQSYTTFYQVLNINGTNYTDVSLSRRANIGSQTQVGINVFGSIPVTNKLNLRSNIQAGDRSNSNPGNPTVTAFAYRLNLNATYEFGHDLTGEVFGNYQSRQKNLQGTRPAFGFYNIAVRKQFMNKKASLGLTAANPFSQYVTQTTTSFGTNFNQSTVRQVPYRSFGISLSYKFGKLEFKKEKDDNGNNLQQAIPEN